MVAKGFGTKEQDDIFRATDIFCILIVAVVTQLYILLNSLNYIKWVDFILCKLYLNKADV